MFEGKSCKYGFFRIIGGIMIGILVAALFAFVIGALIMVLWNWLMPVIFGLGTITYWQGFGIALLSRLLFGGMGHKGSDHMDHQTHRSGHKSTGRIHRSFTRNRWFDDVYEEWWEAEGAKSFDAYMKRDTNKEQGEEP